MVIMNEFDKKGYCMSLDYRLQDILEEHKIFKNVGIFCDSSELGFAWNETHYWITDNNELDKQEFHWYELADLQEYLSIYSDEGFSCHFDEPMFDSTGSPNCSQDCSNCSLWKIDEVLDKKIFKDLNIVSIIQKGQVK